MKKLLLTILIIGILPVIIVAQKYDKEKQQMVKQQIVDRGIKDTKVIAAMKDVDRHVYVPKNYRDMAYSDRPLPIGNGQTISQPYIVALMTELLELEEGEKVLEIGTGSGYQAAVLSHITSEVYSIEIIEELAEQAKDNLQKQGYDSIKLKIGDGYKGWEEYAPFDAIIVTCAPSDIPEPLKEQLAEGGRMIIPIGDKFIQELVLFEKKNGELEKQEISSVRFVPMLDGSGKKY
ncbi:MAG: protein-L-isoaspartate(D-aspartate) O-methyltransferase [Bacteroidales bacterium]